MDLIKSNLWINSVNQESISTLNDPCVFDIPISFKPTFVNMDRLILNPQAANFMENGNQNFNALKELLDPNVNFPISNLGLISFDFPNHCVWLPCPNSVTIASTIYSSLNAGHVSENPWEGWKNLQKLNASPRAKFSYLASFSQKSQNQKLLALY